VQKSAVNGFISILFDFWVLAHAIVASALGIHDPFNHVIKHIKALWGHQGLELMTNVLLTGAHLHGDLGGRETAHQEAAHGLGLFGAG
jgi:hypothetical protein